MPELTIEEIMEIREALQVISLNAEVVGMKSATMAKIREQVKRIDNLLPKEKAK